jgi:hypothetical protein
MTPSHDWRVTQLTRLGIPGLLTEGIVSHVDWHEIARLMQPDGRTMCPAGPCNPVWLACTQFRPG